MESLKLEADSLTTDIKACEEQINAVEEAIKAYELQVNELVEAAGQAKVCNINTPRFSVFAVSRQFCQLLYYEVLNLNSAGTL